jgi:hypothetical protein
VVGNDYRGADFSNFRLDSVIQARRYSSYQAEKSFEKKMVHLLETQLPVGGKQEEKQMEGEK